jgi:hypothetical protein
MTDEGGGGGTQYKPKTSPLPVTELTNGYHHNRIGLIPFRSDNIQREHKCVLVCRAVTAGGTVCPRG